MPSVARRGSARTARPARACITGETGHTWPVLAKRDEEVGDSRGGSPDLRRCSVLLARQLDQDSDIAERVSQSGGVLGGAQSTVDDDAAAGSYGDWLLGIALERDEELSVLKTPGADHL